MELKEKLTIEKAIELKLSATKVVKFYFPDKSDEECDYILWEETCFPFSNEVMMEQIYKMYTDSLENKLANPS
jgi:hypothetical protein